MINQAICIYGLKSYLLCPMQCHLNGVHISETPKLLAEIPSVTTHAIELTDHFDEAHLIIIPLQLSRVNIYFVVYSLRIAKFENEDIPKIHLIAEEPWDLDK